MATSEQIKSLIRSHWSEDQDHFFTVALQVAAHEAERGHGALAHEIRGIIDRARQKQVSGAVVDVIPELHGLVQTEESTTPLSALVLPDALLARIRRILHEYLQSHKLKQHALTPRSKILLTGPPGTGKTLTARVFAHELRLPLHTVQVDRLVTKFMGETSAKLRQIFDLVSQRKGVYFFDEFDAIGGGRSLDNDVGEMRRVLNALLQFIERDTSESMIVAATNSPQLLDRALFRRFDDVLIYTLPEERDRKRLIENALSSFLSESFDWKSILAASETLSSAEIFQACCDGLKDAILQDRTFVSSDSLVLALHDRRNSHTR
jgi:AAA+ superfamily predicted ATPase